MATEKFPYRRLPGSRILSPTSGWLGADHLLFVSRAFFTETHFRFYYRDIHAFIVVKTVAGKAWTPMLGAALGLILLLNFSVDPSTPGLLITEVALAAALAINLALGPTCSFHIKTAVGVKKLPSVARVRKARRFLDQIRPLIQQAQGPAPTAGDHPAGGAIAAEVFETMPGSPAAPSADLSNSPLPLINVPGGGRRHFTSDVHGILAVVFVAGGVFQGLLSTNASDELLTALFMLVTLTQLLVTVIALIKQAKSDAPAWLTSGPWLGLFYVIVIYLLQFGSFANVVVSRFPSRQSRVAAVPEYLSRAAAILSVAIGAYTLIQYLVFYANRKRSQRPGVPG